MTTIRLQLVIPFHQPLDTDDRDIDSALDSCYLPVLSTIEAQNTRVSLHFSGHLLSFLSRRRPDVLSRLKGMVQRGSVEVLGGLFFGGVPALLPELDLRGQVQMMAEFWESCVGEIPQGFWLPEMAWAPELPRMLDETGLTYGFISSSQLVGAGAHPPPLGVIERGGLGIAAFVAHAGLSSSLPATSPEEWVAALCDVASASRAALITVWVRAESLGLEPGTASWCFEQGWLVHWLSTLTRELQLTLPRENLKAATSAVPLRLRPGIATDLAPLGRYPGPVDWTDFWSQFGEAESLYRRMLRVSDKLRLQIASMEEEGLEEQWSDSLATAQRLVFAAQSPDAYWRGPTPGFALPSLRDAVTQRLCRAESMIDTLAQGEDDWIAAEEEDRDADLADEIFVANRYLGAWIVPARACSIRALDDRHLCRNLLDVGTRRSESYFSDMAQAELDGATGERDFPPRRGAGLVRLSPELPTAVDDVDRFGIRPWLLERNATLSEYLSGSLFAPVQRRPATEILDSQIDEEGDGTYTLRARIRLGLDGLHPRVADIEEVISLPIDAPELTMSLRATLDGEKEALMVVEAPLRLGGSSLTLTLNGQASTVHEAEHPEVSSVQLADERGARVSLALEPALNVWIAPLRTTIRGLTGYRAADEGILVIPFLCLENEARAVLKFTLGS